MNAYDRVMTRREKEDHFNGMTLGNMDAIALEEKAAERLKLYNEAKDAYKIGSRRRAHGPRAADGLTTSRTAPRISTLTPTRATA